MLSKIVEFLTGVGVPETSAVAYCDRVERDYEEMKLHLPARCSAFLDIGCGLGGHALLLAAHYNFRPTAHLIEGNATRSKTKADVKIHDGGEPWIDVTLAMRLLESGGCNRVMAWPANQMSQVRPKCALVVSLAAWGHHISVPTYGALVKDTLLSSGRVIMDIRQNTGGETDMEAGGFERIAVIRRARKFDRLVFVRRK